MHSDPNIYIEEFTDSRQFVDRSFADKNQRNQDGPDWK